MTSFRLEPWYRGPACFEVWPMSYLRTGRGVWFVTYYVASHQGAFEMFWLHFWGAVMLSIFIYVNGFQLQLQLNGFNILHAALTCWLNPKDLCSRLSAISAAFPKRLKYMKNMPHYILCDLFCGLWTCGKLQIAALKATLTQRHSVPVHYGCICSKPPESKLSIICCSGGQRHH